MTPLDILIHTTNELGRCLDNISSLSPSPPFITREVIIQLTRLWSLSNSATLSLDLSVKPKIIQPDYFQGPSE